MKKLYVISVLVVIMVFLTAVGYDTFHARRIQPPCSKIPLDENYQVFYQDMPGSEDLPQFKGWKIETVSPDNFIVQPFSATKRDDLPQYDEVKTKTIPPDTIHCDIPQAMPHPTSVCDSFSINELHRELTELRARVDSLYDLFANKGIDYVTKAAD